MSASAAPVEAVRDGVRDLAPDIEPPEMDEWIVIRDPDGRVALTLVRPYPPVARPYHRGLGDTPSSMFGHPRQGQA
ncbi:hypothetical protein GCM10025786_20510 [Nocardioides caeni]